MSETPARRLKQKKEYLEELKAAQDIETDWGEISHADNHPGDTGAETYMGTLNLGFKEKIDLEIEKVEKALGKVRAGDYGLCENCGYLISQERLQAIPEAELCMACIKENDSLPRVSE